ncbi:MAG: hypothetical protein GTO55_09390, partial [Armatimonadetes bacterium]|nr:hypothetical protein [Armatimonadota bacterium]NIM24460.1 hypothetical protein [Armatimonadota bacterium]NIM68331.1 hypothetical protein [Armatimonadota bacterium]NIM76735.1 hypothetical protein [Armatimonadota bacterium]NIN06534.1 hypothetical protein [Armatimonadota bacterium]
MMWLVAATGPARATTTVFVIIALLVTGLAAILLLRLWALVRQERRRCRQESLTSLAALLRAPEKSTRLHALTLLASFPLMELSAVEGPLWDMMKDPEPEVRQAANRLMLMLHPPDQLLHQLSGRQMPEKLGAIEGLAAIGGQKALAALLEAAARASEEPIRRAAKAALARGESPGVSPFLITALDSTDPILRATAKDVFRDCGLRALPPLLATLRDPRKPFRATAAELIGDLGLQEGAEALVSLLSDPVDEVRAQAARALGNLGQSGPGIMAALAEALSDSSTLVQEEAANALSSIDDSKALVPLLEFLRQRASRAANWHTPPVLPAQFISRHLPANSASLSACKHLFESADDAFLSTLARIMEESPENVKKDWIERLPSLADDMRETLHSLLVSLGKHGLREPFRKQIHDHSPANAAARAAVARLLGEIEADDLGEEIFALLSDPDYEVRRAAAWAGGRIPHFATIDGLCQALSDPDTEVRTGAARSLT